MHLSLVAYTDVKKISFENSFHNFYRRPREREREGEERTLFTEENQSNALTTCKGANVEASGVHVHFKIYV